MSTSHPASLTRQNIPVQVPVPVRAAQVLMLVPLGLLQLGAATYFTLTAPVLGIADQIVAGWAIAMSSGCIIVAARLGRPDRQARRLAFGLMGLQLAFAAVKLFAYGESVAIIFGAIAAAAVVLLARPARPPKPHAS